MTESTDLRCFLYHATHEPRIFDTEAEIEAALADGWADSPAKAEALVAAPEAIDWRGFTDPESGDVAEAQPTGKSKSQAKRLEIQLKAKAKDPK